MTSNLAARRAGALLLVVAMAGAALLMVSTGASAVIVPTVPLRSAENFSVLAGSTVTNSGPSTLQENLGLSPGTSVTGFPPGEVTPPATTEVANGVAEQAQTDLTGAYVDARDRPDAIEIPADPTGQTLVGGVYAAEAKGPLLLTGALVLDGENNPNSVFIFQTDSTLTTGGASSVTLINGAQECNVFWQVGSSATLGGGSVFRGNILALTSITVNNGVTVYGRALASNGAVTLINDTFRAPTCDLRAITTTSDDGSSSSSSSSSTSTSTSTTSTTSTPTSTSSTTSTTAPEPAPTTTSIPVTTSTTSTTVPLAAPTTSTTAPQAAPTTSTPVLPGPPSPNPVPGFDTSSATPGPSANPPDIDTSTDTPADSSTTGGGTPEGTPRIDTSTATPGETTSRQTDTPGPGLPAVAAAPRTGGAPLRTEAFPWVSVLFATLLGAAGTAGTLASRRAQPRVDRSPSR